MTEEPTITHTVVSQSHSPFFYFSMVLESRPVTQLPLKEKKKNLRLSVVMETSQVSVCPAVAPAVHCGICGEDALLPAQRREALQRKRTERPTNFCCILSV